METKVGYVVKADSAIVDMEEPELTVRWYAERRCALRVGSVQYTLWFPGDRMPEACVEIETVRGEMGTGHEILVPMSQVQAAIDVLRVMLEVVASR